MDTTYQQALAAVIGYAQERANSSLLAFTDTDLQYHKRKADAFTRIWLDLAATLANAPKLTAADLAMTEEDKAINGKLRFHGCNERAVTQLERAEYTDSVDMMGCVAHNGNGPKQAVRAANALRERLFDTDTDPTDYLNTLIKVANEFGAPDETVEEVYNFNRAREQALEVLRAAEAVSLRSGDWNAKTETRYRVANAAVSCRLGYADEMALLYVVRAYYPSQSAQS